MVPLLLIQPTCRWSQYYQAMNIYSALGINTKKICIIHKAPLKLLNASESQVGFFCFTNTWIVISRGCSTEAIGFWPSVLTDAEPKVWFVARTGKISLWLLYTCILIWTYRYLVWIFIQIHNQLNDISRRSWGCKKVPNNICKKYRKKPDAWQIQLELVGLQALPGSLLKLMEWFSLHYLGLAFDCKCMPIFQKHKMWIIVKAAHENTANSLKRWWTG